MPVPSLHVWPRAASRLVVALCAFTLLVTAIAVSTEPAAGRGLGDAIASSRRGQSYAESAMLAADAQFARIKAQARVSSSALRHAKRSVKRGYAALGQAKSVILKRRARLAEAETILSDPPEDAQIWMLERRVRGLRRDVRSAERRKATISQRLRANVRARKARQYRLSSLRRQRASAVGRRESAEGVLSAYMSRMTDLARARVQHQTSVHLAAGSSFSWPAVGRITQTYGCTGFYLNPRRGSCRHFHDGLDIVAGYGSGVRATAVGVVAYAGWNPYDEGGRAWIVVIVHPDGYVSRYGHMIPGDRVRVGELVHTGQLIGRMGNTGRSTGTHLHFELLRGSSDINPLSYLPSGGAKIKVDRSSAKKGKGNKATRHKRKAAARRSRAEARRERAADRRKRDEETGAATLQVGFADLYAQDAGSAPVTCDDALTQDDIDTANAALYDLTVLAIVEDQETYPACATGSGADLQLRRTDRGDGAADQAAPADASGRSQPPGVPVPPRGTSPVPR